MSNHGGNIRELAVRLGCPPEEILDFSANINPLGPPDSLWNILAARLPDIIHYPDPDSTEFTQALAAQYQVPAEQIVPGNGTSDLLYAALRAVGANPCVRPCLPGRHWGLPLRITARSPAGSRPDRPEKNGPAAGPEYGRTDRAAFFLPEKDAGARPVCAPDRL